MLDSYNSIVCSLLCPHGEVLTLKPYSVARWMQLESLWKFQADDYLMLVVFVSVKAIDIAFSFNG